MVAAAALVTSSAGSRRMSGWAIGPPREDAGDPTVEARHGAANSQRRSRESDAQLNRRQALTWALRNAIGLRR
jgi:hypothetical protein